MTVPANPFRDEHTCDGVQTVFDYSWYLRDKSHIKVTRSRIDGTEADLPLVEGANYTVAGVGNTLSSTWKITTSIAYSNLYKLVFTGNLPAEQATDYSAVQSVKPATVEDNIDYVVGLIKQIFEILTRVPTLPVGTSASVLPADYLNQILAVVSSWTGTSTTSVAIGTGSRSWTTQPSRDFAVGRSLIITSDADPANRRMSGVVTAYNPTTGALTVNVTRSVGAGTFTDWTIRVSGEVGEVGPSGSLTDGDYGDVTVSGSGTVITIDPNTVNNNKLSHMAANTVKVRAAATTGNPSDLAIGPSQLVGRGSTGDMAAITLGTNLSMSGSTLNSAGGVLTSFFESSTLAITSGHTVAHGLSGIPRIVRVVMRCSSADLGYSTGDEIMFTGDRGDNWGFQFYANATNVVIVRGANGLQIWNTSGAISAPNTSSWSFVVYAWR